MFINKMFTAIKNWWNDPDWPEPFWTIRAYLIQPVVFTKPYSYVLQNDGLYTAGNARTDKYVHFDVNNREVKVKSIDILRYEYFRFEPYLPYMDKIEQINLDEFLTFLDKEASAND